MYTYKSELTSFHFNREQEAYQIRFCPHLHFCNSHYIECLFINYSQICLQKPQMFVSEPRGVPKHQFRLLTFLIICAYIIFSLQSEWIKVAVINYYEDCSRTGQKFYVNASLKGKLNSSKIVLLELNCLYPILFVFLKRPSNKKILLLVLNIQFRYSMQVYIQTQITRVWFRLSITTQ